MRFSRSKSVLLAGATALALLAGPAMAQQQDERFYLEADLLIQNDRDKLVTAQGDVEVRYQGRTLRANEIVYDLGSGVITASGQAQIVNPDGTVQFADSITLDEDLRSGVAKGFSARLEGNVKIAADTAVRRSDAVTELNRAIYTPCEVCVEEGKTHGPTWSITAEKVVQDRDAQIVYYRNATVTLFGVPVLYLPVFWHPDPQAGRHSGLLSPSITVSGRRGLSYEQPYLQVLSPYSDIIVSPQVNAKVNPFLNAHYRRRFYSGQTNVRAGYTYEQDLRGDGVKFGEETSRSYILASGKFDLSQAWRWGFTAERTSDELIFEKYDVNDVHVKRGLFPGGDQRLISQLYAERQDQQSYFSIAAISIQGLRPFDYDPTFPLIAPLIEGRWEPKGPVLGGRLRVLGSAVVLTRDRSQFAAALPGIDSRRGTAQLDWRDDYTSAGGLRFSPFVQARTDLYSLGDLPAAAGEPGKTFARGLGTAGVDVSWPFFRRDGDRTIVIEPLAQLAASPKAEHKIIGYDLAGEPIYFDEDSVALEFDDTNLFRINKFPGFDRYESGERLNVGARASVSYDDGRAASILVGRTFRAEQDPVLPRRSGLRSTASDWIVAAEATPLQSVQLFTKARIDLETATLRRLEVGADVDLDRARGYVRYLRDDLDITGVPREDVDFAGEVFLTSNWGLTFSGVRNLEADIWRRRDFGALYRDDCLELAVVYVHEEHSVLGKSDSIALRLTLATLGDKGYSQ